MYAFIYCSLYYHDRQEDVIIKQIKFTITTNVNNPARNPTNLPTLNPYNPILPFVSPAPVVVANGTPQQITVSQNIRLVAVSAYDTEDTNNESKRSIDIIKKDYTTQIEKELSILLSK